MGNGAVKPKSELLNCTICFNVFKIPRMLPCQHTFCETCLRKYITETMAHSEEKKDFPCPICRDVITPPYPEKARVKWARQFPKNRLLLTLFDEDPKKVECCRDHPGKLIEFFCESHVQIGCSTCLLTQHKSCDVLQLEMYFNSGKFKRSCQKNNGLLLQYKKMFEDMVVEVGKNLDALDNEKTRLIAEAKSMRTDIDNLLNVLEEKFITSVQDNYKRECDMLCEQSSKCRKVINDVMATIEKMHAAETDISMVQKSEIIVVVEEKLTSFGTTIREEHGDFQFVNMNIIFDPLVEQIKSMVELGKIEIERSRTTLPLPDFVPKTELSEPPPDVKRHRSKYVAKVGEFSVSGEDEHFFCNITSSVILSDGRILLVDDSNCKIKVLDGRFKYLTELKLDSNPLNIARVNETEVAVSLPGKREVAFITVSSELSLRKSISTRLDCWGLEIMDNVVIVTTGRDGHSVILTDMDGKELNAFLLTVHSDENIRCPVAVVADKRQKILYVTCTGGAWSKGCVISINLTGKLLNIYQDPNLDTPRSCSIDRHGKIYICGLESSTVYQLTQAGDVFRVFPSKTEQVIGPLHVNFLQNFHIRFLLTEVASDVMKIYELPTQKYTK